MGSAHIRTRPSQQKDIMRYRLLIVAVTIIWGSSFVIVKDVTNVVSPAWLLAIRFSVAAVILACIFAHGHGKLYRDPGLLMRGAVLGTALFAAYYLQTVGITDTTPGKNAFLTATYCVIVPFTSWALSRRRPTAFNVVAAAVGLAAIGLISLDDNLTLRFGDAMTLACAVFYALHISLVARLARGRDIYVLTMWQFATVAVWSVVFGCALETPPLGALDTETLVQIAYLAVVVTAVALLFQNIGQKHVPPAQAGLLLSLESVFGAAFSIALGAEDLTLRIGVGFCVMFCAILISELGPSLYWKIAHGDD